MLISCRLSPLFSRPEVFVFLQLRAITADYAAFQREAGAPSTQVAGDDLSSQSSWTLGDLPTLVRLSKEKEKSTMTLADESAEIKRKIAELQSLMLKADTKMEEAARFLRAKDDPDFAKVSRGMASDLAGMSASDSFSVFARFRQMVRVRQLGPEHLENQQRLRMTTQVGSFFLHRFWITSPAPKANLTLASLY